jgi:sugar lactone lactonase YvrE
MKTLNALLSATALACATQNLSAQYELNPTNGIYVWTDETRSPASRAALINACADPSHFIQVVLLSVWDNDTYSLWPKPNLGAFNTAAHEAGLRVFALVTETNQILDVVNFNTSLAAAGDAAGCFDACAMDYEPTAWPDSRLAAPSTYNDIKYSYGAAKSACGSLPLHVSISWGWHALVTLPNGTQEPAYEAIIDAVDSVDVQTAFDTGSQVLYRITNAPPNYGGPANYAAAVRKPLWATIETQDLGLNSAWLLADGTGFYPWSTFYWDGEATMWDQLAQVVTLTLDTNPFIPFTGFMLHYYKGAYSSGNPLWPPHPAPTLAPSPRVEGPGPGSDSVVLAPNFRTSWTAEVAPDSQGWLYFGSSAAPASSVSAKGADVVFSYDQNTGPTRTGTITVDVTTVDPNGVQTLTFTVIQAGSGYLGTFSEAPRPVTALEDSDTMALQTPAGVAVDASGNVFFTDAGSGTGNGMVYEWLAPNGPATALVASSAVPTGFTPTGVAVDAAGNVYIADSANQTVWQWSPESPGSLTAAVNYSMYSGCGLLPGFTPIGVAVDGAGNVYIADANPNGPAIEEWTPGEICSKSITTLVAANSAKQSGIPGPIAVVPGLVPSGVAVDAAGNVYIADSGNKAIDEWAPGNTDLSPTYQGWGVGAHTLVSGFNDPQGVAVDGAGNLYIADSGQIEEWTAATGNTSTLVSSALLPAGFPGFNPVGVAADGAGDVYVADAGSPAIEELPYAFVDTAGVSEPSSFGSDSLPPVLPNAVNLNGPFAPSSDSPSWLRVSGTSDGVVSFVFSPNITASYRSGNLNVLGAPITVRQGPSPSPATFGTDGCYPPSASVLYWWPGQGFPTDIVGGNTAVLQGLPNLGVTYGSGNGEGQQAFYFDGSSGFLATSDNIISAPTTFTLECWFNTVDPAISQGGVLIGFSSSQCGTSGGDQYDRILYMDDSGCLHFGVWYNGSAQTADCPFSCNDGDWHHLAATLSAPGGDGINLYVDGFLVANNPNAQGAQVYSGWWRIGEDNLNNWPFTPPGNGLNLPSYFAGAIEEVSIYSGELSWADIEGIYDAAAAGKCLPPATAQPQQPGQAVTVAVPPASGQGGIGITATLNSSSGDSASQLPTVSAAIYGSTDPESGNFGFGPESAYFDLQVQNATPNDSMTAYFYYPGNNLLSAPTLLYYNANNNPQWQAVSSDSLKAPGSAQQAPAEVLQNESTVQYTVLFDNNSVPLINDLGGTVFVLATAPPTPLITWATPAPIVYGTALGPAQLDATANIQGTFSYNPPAGTVLRAGAGQILSVTFTPADTADYPKPLAATVAINVSAAPLTIAASAQSKTYGHTLNLGRKDFITRGLVNGDTVARVRLASPGAAATATVAGSPYAITPGAAIGRGLGNYVISYQPGRLTVNPAALTITARPQRKTYGQTMNLGTKAFTTRGLRNQDAVTGVMLTSPGAAATAPPGDYPIVPSRALGTGLANYNISYRDGTLRVTRTGR